MHASYGQEYRPYLPICADSVFATGPMISPPSGTSQDYGQFAQNLGMVV
jgi:hypothetical protein